MEKVLMNMKVLDKLSALEFEILEDIKSIDSQVKVLRECRSRLFATVRSINPDVLRKNPFSLKVKK